MYFFLGKKIRCTYNLFVYLYMYELAYSIDDIDIVICLIKYFYLNSNFIVMFMILDDVCHFDYSQTKMIFILLIYLKNEICFVEFNLHCTLLV
jgi:hypothetical protein